MSWPFWPARGRYVRSPVTYNGLWPGTTSAENWTVTTAFTSSGTSALNGTTTIGDASTDTCTMTGRLIMRKVDDTGMAATPGTQGEVVFNEDDSIFYGCTVTDATAATWAALHS